MHERSPRPPRACSMIASVETARDIRALDRRATIAFGAALLTLLAVGAVAYWAIIVSDERERAVNHTHDVLGQLRQLLTDVVVSQSSSRGFAISRDARELAAYQRAIPAAADHVAAVRSLTLDNPAQQDQLPLLEQLLRDNEVATGTLINLPPETEKPAIAAALLSGHALDTMGKIRKLVLAMQDEELRLLTERNLATAESVDSREVILLIGTSLGLAVIIIAGLIVRRDARRRRQAERSMAESEARYRCVLEAAPDAMVVSRPSGEIVLANRQAEKQFGYEAGALIGLPLADLLAEAGLGEHGDAVAADADRTGIERVGRHQDGSEFPVELTVSHFENADGLLLTTAIRDITVRQRAEGQLAETMAELKRSNTELGQFAHLASHDLQEPLRMVASYTQLLGRRYKGKLDADADEFIGFAVDGAHRMQRLIQDLLMYSQVGTKRNPLAAVSSEEALLTSLKNLRSAIADSKAEISHDTLPMVLADQTQLVQLFQNLIGNAIKYQAPGRTPQIHISAKRRNRKSWEFSVQDNGLGIEEKYYSRIFGMFQRLHSREQFAGTGIGLAICKKIVEQHGGTISVESQPNIGSVFQFSLSASEA